MSSLITRDRKSNKGRAKIKGISLKKAKSNSKKVIGIKITKKVRRSISKKKMFKLKKNHNPLTLISIVSQERSINLIPIMKCNNSKK